MTLGEVANESRAWCVLGSNQGDRVAMLRQAAFLLHARDGVRLESASRIYETPPWGDTFQEPFLNAAVELRTRLEPEALLDVFQDIETRLGRPSRDTRQRWGPRPIDIDLALFENRTIHTDRLVVPHPRLSERAFALLPLLDIAPEAADPISGEAYEGALARLERDAEKCRVVEPLLYEKHEATDAGTRFANGETDTVLLRATSPEMTESVAESLGRTVRGGEIIALSGNLGAGKTCLTRGLARGLGISEPITSPSYVLVKSYEGRLTLHHADFYRLACAEEDAPGSGHGELDLATLGLEDYLDDPESVLAVEWADRFPAWLEPPFLLVRMHGAGDEPRLVLLRRIGG